MSIVLCYQDCDAEEEAPEQVKKKCEGKNKCEVRAKKGTFDDECEDSDAYLVVEYECKGKPG